MGCPMKKSPESQDLNRIVSCPTFAICAACKHQAGINFEIRDFDLDWSSEIFPERLKCGYPVVAELLATHDQATERAC
jgi:hypothetical protein